MATKVLAKLELHPINASSELALAKAFRDAEKLATICFRYFDGVLRARENPELTANDIKIIKSLAGQFQIHLPSDTVIETIKRIYTNFRTARETFGSRPKKIHPFIPIRVTKTTSQGKKYERNLRIEEIGSPEKVILAVVANLGDKLHRRRTVCYVTSESEREPFRTIRAALKGEGVFLGDPSILVKREGRYFLHLSATREPEEHRNKRRILGVDLGISGPIAAMFAIEVKKGVRKKEPVWGDYTLIKSNTIASDEFRRMWFELLRKRAKRMSRAMKGTGGATSGQRFAEVTALGDSLHSERSKQFVYRVVNQTLGMAEELGCGAVAFESLRSFRGVLHGKKKYAKTLGIRYNWCLKHGKQAEAAELLQKIREVKKQIKLLQALPWGRFAEDLKSEAEWRGIRAIPVKAAGTSTACPRCGNASKENRRGRGFKCTGCGFSMQADLLAALNIAVSGYVKLKKARKTKN